MLRLLLLTGMVGLAGCSTLTGPDTRRVVGLIDAGGSSLSTIVAPDTVQAGATFTATVHSFGSSSCTTPDGVELTLAPTEARVTPYDRVPADRRAVCTADLSPHPHPVELRFTRAGLAIIVAQGEVIDATTRRRTPGAVTKQLLVLPYAKTARHRLTGAFS
jgi:hypothetical protein